MRIKKGDIVKIITGKDGGKTGKILRMIPTTGKVLVEGLNVFKKHSRPKRQGEKGEMVMVARPVDMSNVMPVCPSCGKATRLSFGVRGSAKSRVCKKCSASF